MGNKNLKSNFLASTKAQRKIIWDGVPIVDGLPVFSGDTTTFWTMLRAWEGPVTIGDTTYNAKFTNTKWIILDMDKRHLKDGLQMTFNKVWKDFQKAFADEQECRKLKSGKNKKMLNSQYYQENREHLDLVRKENMAIAKVKHEERTNEVFRMLIDGKPKHEIIQFFVKRDGIEERTVQRSIIAAYSKVKEMVASERDILREKHIAQLQKLYEKNIDNGDLREARAVLESLNKMLGLNEPEKKQLEVKQQIIRFNFDNPISDDEVNRIKANSQTIDATDIEFKEVKTNKPPTDDDIILNEEE